jgi:hypothetical protein
MNPVSLATLAASHGGEEGAWPRQGDWRMPLLRDVLGTAPSGRGTRTVTVTE